MITKFNFHNPDSLYFISFALCGFRGMTNKVDCFNIFQ
jgi:hypothetical protein